MSKDKDSKPTGDSRVADLIAALKATLAYLPSCGDGENPDCGPPPRYTPRCPYIKATAAIAKAEKDNNR